MKIPLELAFHNMDHSDAVEQRVRERVDRLEKFFQNITSCRVVIDAPHKSEYHTQHYKVRVDVTVPGRELVVSESPTDDNRDDVYVAIRDAFDAAERRIKKYADKMRDRARTAAGRVEPPSAIIAKLFEDGYGFLEAVDGREIYFHRNSVLNEDFEELEVGTRVTYHEEQGEKGPQASTVKVVGSVEAPPASGA